MMDLAFLLFNALIFFTYVRLLAGWGITRCAEKFVIAFLLTMVQVMGALLFLGAVGWLRPLEAVALNSVILLSLHCFAVPVAPVLPRGGAWQEILRPLSNKVIMAWALVFLGWLLLCAYFLPPRGVDDITYHLPFVYESVQRGQWALLPTDLRIHFAYPMNMEVLFAWPVLLLGDTRWVDAVQIPVGLWAAAMIYLFARHFGLRRARAFLLAGMFLFTPIVIAQAGTNYIDLSSAGFLLSSLYLTVRALRTGKPVYFRLAFLSTGAMMGMKYHLLFCGLVLGPVLALMLVRMNRKGELPFGLAALAGLGAGWHLRNHLVLGDWLAPVRGTAGAWGMGDRSAEDVLLLFVRKTGAVFIDLVNNGTVDGGFGRYYGLMVFLVGILLGWRFLLRKRNWQRGEVLFFGMASFFLLLLIPISREEFPWIGPRILLAVWPMFLLVFGRVVFVLNRKAWVHGLVLAMFFFGAAQDMPVVVNSAMPHHAWQARAQHSQFETYPYSSWYVGRLGPCASALDVMTRSLPRRSTVFLAAPVGQFFSAPFYGRSLQAKIVNFDPQFTGDPDFLVYLTISPEPLTYIGRYRKTPEDALAAGYRQVFSDLYGTVLARPGLTPRGGG